MVAINYSKRVCAQNHGIIKDILKSFENEITRQKLIKKVSGQYNLEKVASILRQDVRMTYKRKLKTALGVPEADHEDPFYNSYDPVIDEKKIDDVVKRILALFPRSLRKAPEPATVVKPEVRKRKMINTEVVKTAARDTKDQTSQQQRMPPRWMPLSQQAQPQKLGLVKNGVQEQAEKRAKEMFRLTHILNTTTTERDDARQLVEKRAEDMFRLKRDLNIAKRERDDARQLAETRSKELDRLMHQMNIKTAQLRVLERERDQSAGKAHIASLKAEVEELNRVNTLMRKNSVAQVRRVQDLMRYIKAARRDYPRLPDIPRRG